MFSILRFNLHATEQFCNAKRWALLDPPVAALKVRQTSAWRCPGVTCAKIVLAGGSQILCTQVVFMRGHQDRFFVSVTHAFIRKYSWVLWTKSTLEREIGLSWGIFFWHFVWQRTSGHVWTNFDTLTETFWPCSDEQVSEWCTYTAG